MFENMLLIAKDLILSNPIIIFVLLPLVFLVIIYFLNNEIKKKTETNEEKEKNRQLKPFFSGLILILSLILLVIFGIYAFFERQENFMLIASIAPPIIGNMMVSVFIKEKKTSIKASDPAELEKQGVFIISSTLIFIIFVLLHIDKMSKYEPAIYILVSGIFMVIMLLMLGAALSSGQLPTRGQVMFFGTVIDSPDFRGGFFILRVLYILAIVFFIIISHEKDEYKTMELCYDKYKYSYLSTDIRDKYPSLDITRRQEDDLIRIIGKKNIVDDLIKLDCNGSLYKMGIGLSDNNNSK